MVFSSSFHYSSLTSYFNDNPKLDSDMAYLSLSNLLDTNKGLNLNEKIHGKYSLLEFLLMRGIPNNKNQVLEISPLMTKNGWPLNLNDFNSVNILESGCFFHRNWLQAAIASCFTNLWKVERDKDKELPKEVELAIINDDSELLVQLLKLPGAPSLEEVLSSPFEGYKFIDGLGSSYGNWWRYLLSHISDEKTFSKNIVHLALSHGLEPVSDSRKDHPCFSASLPAIEMLLDFDVFPKELIEDWCKSSLSNRKWLKLYSVDKIDRIIQEVHSVSENSENKLDNKQEKMLFTKTLMKFWGEKGAHSIYDVFNEIVDSSELDFNSFISYKDKVAMFSGDWNLPSLPILLSIYTSTHPNCSKIEVTEEVIQNGFKRNDFTKEDREIFKSVNLGDGNFSLYDLLVFDDNYTKMCSRNSYNWEQFVKKIEVDDKFSYIVSYLNDNFAFQNNLRGSNEFLQFNQSLFETTSRVLSPQSEKIKLNLLRKRFEFLISNKFKDKKTCYLPSYNMDKFHDSSSKEFQKAFEMMDASKDLVELSFLKLILIDSDSSIKSKSWENEKNYIDLYFSKYSSQIEEMLMKFSKSDLLSVKQGNIQKYLIEKCIELSLISNKSNSIKRERF